MDFETSLVVSIVVYCTFFGFIGYFIGANREAGAAGALMGVLLGPIGILIAAISADGRKKCPQCLERVNTNAKICASCRTPLEWISCVPYKSFNDYLKKSSDKMEDDLEWPSVPPPPSSSSTPLSLPPLYEDRKSKDQQKKSKSDEDFEKEEDKAIRALNWSPSSSSLSPPPQPPPLPPRRQ
jgi:hypothetical protein